MTIDTAALTDAVGVEVRGLTPRDLQRHDIAGELDRLLAEHGVLVFREIAVDDAAQIAFSRQLGDVQVFRPDNEFPEIFVVSLDPAKNTSAAYLRGSLFWHIDGAMDAAPNKATMLSAKAVADEGGETEFCSTYVAYDSLPDVTKARIEGLRVVHSFAASQLMAEPDAPEAVREEWRLRRPNREQPLVWTHRDGRRSLVLGSTVSHITGWDADASVALLGELHEWSVQEPRVYRHTWTVGDLVVWDNRGTMHRAVPYAPDSPRVMHRTTIQGDETFD